MTIVSLEALNFLWIKNLCEIKISPMYIEEHHKKQEEAPWKSTIKFFTDTNDN